jgi:hypothetical protein
MAQAKYRSTLDLTEVYEQICIDPKDVPKTAFSTIVGTFISNVLQMGDTNSPSMCQCLRVHIFQELIRRCAHVYMDNIFIFSTSIEKHKEYLRQVFMKLREVHMYLSRKKVELYMDSVECLGHLVDSRGIYANADKMAKVWEWCQPQTYNDILRFLGLVQYMAPYIPDIMAYTMPLSGCAKDNWAFEWTPLLNRCFESIKHLVVWAPILKPINPTHPDTIWVITDGSNVSVGAVYSQGPD